MPALLTPDHAQRPLLSGPPEVPPRPTATSPRLPGAAHGRGSRSGGPGSPPTAHRAGLPGRGTPGTVSAATGRRVTRMGGFSAERRRSPGFRGDDPGRGPFERPVTRPPRPAGSSRSGAEGRPPSRARRLGSSGPPAVTRGSPAELEGHLASWGGTALCRVGEGTQWPRPPRRDSRAAGEDRTWPCPRFPRDFQVLRNVPFQNKNTPPRERSV